MRMVALMVILSIVVTPTRSAAEPQDRAPGPERNGFPASAEQGSLHLETIEARESHAWNPGHAT